MSRSKILREVRAIFRESERIWGKHFPQDPEGRRRIYRLILEDLLAANAD